jgi:hypothetical protein
MTYRHLYKTRDPICLRIRYPVHPDARKPPLRPDCAGAQFSLRPVSQSICCRSGEPAATLRRGSGDGGLGQRRRHPPSLILLPLSSSCILPLILPFPSPPSFFPAILHLSTVTIQVSSPLSDCYSLGVVIWSARMSFYTDISAVGRNSACKYSVL